MNEILTLNYSDVKVDYRLPVAIDFSQDEPTLVNFNHGEKITRPISTTITLGSFLSKSALRRITSDSNSMQRFVCLNTTLQSKVNTDLNLFKEFFFRSEDFLEVQSYCFKILPKIAARVKKFTPRIRRTYLLAVCESFTRRKITKDLLGRINDRFAYTRTIKRNDIYLAKNNLEIWQYLVKSDTTFILQDFYHKAIANITRVSELIDDQLLAVLSQVKEQIADLMTNQKDELLQLIKHFRDKDYLARMFIYVFTAKIASEKKLKLNKPVEDPFLQLLFIGTNHSLDYSYWNYFTIKKKLQSAGLYPGVLEKC